MKLRKILAAALSLALAASIFAGCSKGGDTSSKAPATTTSGSSASGGSEGTTLPELPNNTLSITVARPQFNEPAEGAEVQKMWDEMMPKYLGCTLDITWEETLWNDYLTNQPTQMASGTFADVIPFGTTTKDLPNQYGPDQMLIDLSKYKDLFVITRSSSTVPPAAKKLFITKTALFMLFTSALSTKIIFRAHSPLRHSPIVLTCFRKTT